jgi:CO/xanthine dehydrogenase FAD-binding subunit
MTEITTNVMPDCDITVADIIKITGISKNRAYRLKYWGEYRIGSGQKSRRIRREEFVYRRQNGLDITINEK